jgi:hypothetical protein
MVQRELGYTETHFKIVNDLAATGVIVAMIRVAGPLTVDMVRSALESLQIRHPVLRAYFGHSGDECDYLEVDEESVKIPLDVRKRTVDGQWLEVFEEYLGLRFAEGERYLWRSTLLTSESGKRDDHELVAAFSHSIMDGVSVGSLYGEFMDYCDLICGGEQPDVQSFSLSPAVEDLVTRQASWPAFVERVVELWGAQIIRMSEYLGRYEQIVPPERRRNKTLFCEFEEGQLEKLIHLCRENRTTLTSLLSAALMIAVSEVNIGKDQEGRSKQVAVTARSLRDSCEPVIGKERLGCYIDLVPTTHAFDDDTSLWEIAFSYKSQLVQFMERDIGLPPRFSKPDVIKMFSSHEAAPFRDAFHWGLGITNIGLLDYPANRGPFTVKKLHFCTSDILGAFLMKLHALSMEDRLFCCLSYVEPLLSEKTARAIAANFVSVLESISGRGVKPGFRP